VSRLPTFADGYHRRRCLIPLDRFYEWTASKPEQRFRLALKDGELFAAAGLWDEWTRTGRVRTATMITTKPNELIGAFHHRMPVIVPPYAWADWLDPTTPVKRVMDMLKSYPSELMTCEPAPRLAA
jgi:putative SOS response-associated peptidase YedK